MHFEVNNCEFVNNEIGYTKTCHCAEQNWVQGARAGAFGEEVGNVYLQFYKEGTMPSDKMKTWAEMNYDAFNIISGDLRLNSPDDRTWTQEAIENWDVCNVSLTPPGSLVPNRGLFSYFRFFYKLKALSLIDDLKKLSILDHGPNPSLAYNVL